jgi:hypothetical protein
MKQGFCFLVIVSCILIACRKDAPTNVPMYNEPVSPDAMSLAYFKVGTYWIYQDSATGKIDSTYVTQNISCPNTIEANSAEAQHFGYGGYFGEEVVREVSSYFGLIPHYPYTYQPQIERRIDPHNDTTYIWVQGTNGYINFPYTVGSPKMSTWYTSNFGQVTDTMLILTDQANYLLNNVLLNNVIVMTHTRDVNPNGTATARMTKTYMRKNYGILRKEVEDSSRIWNLIRCHIVQ